MANENLILPHPLAPCRRHVACGIAFCVLFLIVPRPGPLLATPPPPDSLAEQIAVQLTVDRLGSTIIPALYRDERVFLPLTEIFRFLEVKVFL